MGRSFGVIRDCQFISVGIKIVSSLGEAGTQFMHSTSDSSLNDKHLIMLGHLSEHHNISLQSIAADTSDRNIHRSCSSMTGSQIHSQHAKGIETGIVVEETVHFGKTEYDEHGESEKGKDPTEKLCQQRSTILRIEDALQELQRQVVVENVHKIDNESISPPILFFSFAKGSALLS